MSNLHRFAAAVVLIVSGMSAASSSQQAPPLGAASLSVVELSTEYAQKVSGTYKVHAIMGGFHLIDCEA